MNNRKENLLKVKDQIADAAVRAGRNPDDITLLAVSKVFGIEDIREVYNLGQRDFGESRAQELRDKAPQMPDDVIWHFIGPLQTNKIKYVIPNANLIHAVDSVKLARAIAEFGSSKEISPSILVEINTSQEEQKHGFSPDETIDKVLEIMEISGITVKGLMTMAPFTDHVFEIRESFSTLKKLHDRILQQKHNSNFNILSMGMSGDFEIAIEEGSTLVRIGTAIFGKRKRPA
ncbi:MAG: YggS family pyridoxal phosphate-dependent enzyme [Calditrichae bacterium]|nr:YggS family pyridoxal phosphate-dependent enzyme [Calditrichia bacterium]